MKIKFEDRTVMMRNNYLRFLGNMYAQEVDLDRMRSAGEELNAKLATLVEEETQKGHDSIRVIPDLLDLKVLSDKTVFTDEMKQVLAMSLSVSDNAVALHELGFDSPTSYGNFNVASAQISLIGKRVAMRIYNRIVAAVNDPSLDDMIVDIAINALADQIQERASFDRYAKTHGIECPDNESRAAYMGSYTEWLDQVASDLFAKLVSSPCENILVLPTGIEDVKQVLFEICPVEANSWIMELTPDTIYTGDVFGKVLSFNLPKEDVNRFAQAVQQFITENSVNKNVELGSGQSVSPFYSVNMGSLLLHIIIKASSELWGAQEEISEDTEYIVDFFRQELLELDDTIAYIEATPYRILSVMSNINNLMISRSAYTRASSQDYILAQGALVLAIQNELHKETLETIMEEKADE